MQNIFLLVAILFCIIGGVFGSSAFLFIGFLAVLISIFAGAASTDLEGRDMFLEPIPRKKKK